MNTIQELLNELTKSLSSYGYIRPSSEAIFVNNKFFLCISYDPRETVTIRFGLHKIDCHPQLIRESDIKNLYSSKTLSMLLDELKIDSTLLNKACGGYTKDHLQMPDYNSINTIIISTIDRIQKSFTGHGQDE